MSPFSGLHIDLAWRLRKDWGARPLLRRVARFVAVGEGFEHGQLSIAIVGARAMASLHERFMKLPGPTDVLTFDLDSDRRHGRLDAEIVLCANVARRSVEPRRRTLANCRAELALYLTHGLLHLAGYDDHTSTDSRRMHARENELLQQLGLGAVYSARSSD